MNYTKLIKNNQDAFNDYELLQDFINDYIQDGDTLEDHEDNMHEYADGLMPLYNNDIIKEWQDNPECRGEAASQGLIDGETDPYKIMQADLYTMYYDTLSGDFRTLIDLVDDNDNDNDNDND